MILVKQRAKTAATLFVLGAAAYGCHGDVVEPRPAAAVEWVSVATTRLVASPGDILPDPFVVSVTDASGSPIKGTRVSFRVSGLGAQVSPVTATTDANGHASARWRIGTQASDVQSLTATVPTAGGTLSVTAFAVARPDRAIRLDADDTLLVRFGEIRPSAVRAVDQYGNVFAPVNLAMTVVDTAIARARGDSIEGRSRGYTQARITGAGAEASVVIAVQQVAARIVPTPDTLRLTALGDTARFELAVLDDRALEIKDTTVIVDSVADAVSVRLIGADRVEVVSRAVGSGAITLRLGSVTARVHTIVAQVPTRLVLDRDSLSSDAIGDRVALRAAGFDRLNNEIPDVPVDWHTSDASVATVSGGGLTTTVGDGLALLIATTSGGVADTTRARVRQRAATISFPTSVVNLESLGAAHLPEPSRNDRNGYPVQRRPSFVAGDPSVLRTDSLGVATVTGNGTTTVTATLDDVSDTLQVIVAQRAVRIDAQAEPIMLVASSGNALPITCTAYDANDHALPSTPTARAVRGHAAGAECGSLTAVSSGLDTLVLNAGGLTVQYPVAIALRPIPEQRSGNAIVVDSMPANTGPWAPSARVNSSGQIELYATGYQVTDHRGDLHRYISTDGVTFRYDGVVLRRDSSECDLRGSAIENVTVVPRSDAAGWRMFFSAGSFPCYGWQVFSAVSTDERTWTIEPGIRLGNGGTAPPNAPVTPPWPTGEGMEVDHLPSGEWRMIVSAYERVQPA
jgi:hypothetical protein